MFKPDLLAKVLAGEKTQTRRPARTDECYYRPGRTYAVTLTRGGESQGRVRVLTVDRVPAHEISQEDAAAEGFESPAAFHERWYAMHGYPKGYAWRITFELVPS